MAALIALRGAAATAFGVIVLGLGAACGAFDAGQAVKAATDARFGAGVVVPLLRAALGTLVLRALTLGALVLSALGVLGMLAVLGLLAVLLACTRAITRAGAAATLTLRTALTLTAALVELAVTGITGVTGLAVSSLVGALFVAHASTTRPSAMSLPAPRAHAGASIIFLPAG